MSLIVDIIDRGNGVYVVMPEGHMDADTAVICEEKVKPLLDIGTKVLIFDMNKLDYISSAGLGVIFTAKKFISENKGEFLMTNLKPQIKRVFDIVKALPDRAIFTSIEEADRYLAAIQKKATEE